MTRLSEKLNNVRRLQEIGLFSSQQKNRRIVTEEDQMSHLESQFENESDFVKVGSSIEIEGRGNNQHSATKGDPNLNSRAVMSKIKMHTDELHKLLDALDGNTN